MKIDLENFSTHPILGGLLTTFFIFLILKFPIKSTFLITIWTVMAGISVFSFIVSCIYYQKITFKDLFTNHSGHWIEDSMKIFGTISVCGGAFLLLASFFIF